MNKHNLSEKVYERKFNAKQFSNIDIEISKEISKYELNYMKQYDSFVFGIIHKLVDSFDNTLHYNESIELKQLKLMRSLLKFKIIPEIRNNTICNNKWIYFVNRKKLLHLKEEPTHFTFWQTLYKFYIPK